MNSVKYLLGNADLMRTPLPVFSEEACQLLKRYEAAIRNDQEARHYPDIVSVGYWCRNANILKKKEKFGESANWIGRGLAFHIAPGNIPVNFMFSYLFSLLAGNANLVRVPSRPFPQTDILLRLLSQCLKETPQIAARTAFVTYTSNDEITADFCKMSDVRIIWGGDETVRHIKSFQTKPRCVDITFADRYSIAILSGKAISKADDKTLKQIAHHFYNDTYLMDQNACSSPKLCIWADDQAEARKRFWTALAEEAQKHYILPPSLAVEKYLNLCETIIDRNDIRKISNIGNLLNVITLSIIPDDIENCYGKAGFFYQAIINSFHELIPVLANSKLQTIVYYGIRPEDILHLVINEHLTGVDRIVPIGTAMNIDIDWDGYELAKIMARKVILQ